MRRTTDNARVHATRTTVSTSSDLAAAFPRAFGMDFGGNARRAPVERSHTELSLSSGGAVLWAMARAFSIARESGTSADIPSSRESFQRKDVRPEARSRCRARIQLAMRVCTWSSTHSSRISIICFRKLARSFRRASSNASSVLFEQVARYSSIGLVVFIPYPPVSNETNGSASKRVYTMH